MVERKMRKCIICNKRKVIKVFHYFCPICYNKYKGESWLKEYQNLLKQQERSDKRFEKHTLSFDDIIWRGGRKVKIESVDGRTEEIWVDGELVVVRDILDKNAIQEHLGEE